MVDDIVKEMEPFHQAAVKTLYDTGLVKGVGIGTLNTHKTGGYEGSGLGILVILTEGQSFDTVPAYITARIGRQERRAPTFVWRMASNRMAARFMSEHEERLRGQTAIRRKRHVSLRGGI